MSIFDGLAKFATSPAGIGLLALGGGTLAAPALAGAAGTAGSIAPAAAGAAAGAGGTSGALGLLGGSQVNLANSALLMNGAANPAVAGMAAAAPATSAAPSAGLLSTVNSGLKEYAPLINAAGTGIQAAHNAMGNEVPPPQAPMVQPSMGGTQTLNDIAASQRQRTQDMLVQAEQERMNRRMQRRGLLA